MSAPKIITPEVALQRLEDLCARAEHCTGELRKKLWQWKIPPSKADEIIARLEQNRFIDDARFARAFTRDKVSFQRWGIRKIHVALMAKNVPSNIIKQALEENIEPEAYYQNLLHILKVRAQQMNQDDVRTYNGRTRLYRFALQRGFESNLAAKAIRELFT